MARKRKRPKNRNQIEFALREVLYCEICKRNYVIMATRMWRFVETSYKLGTKIILW